MAILMWQKIICAIGVGAATLLLFAESSLYAMEHSAVAFKIAEPDLIPEGIAFDPVTKVFYVGSTYKRKIVSIDRSGVVRDFTDEAQDGLWGVLGLKVDARRRALWAVSSQAGGGMPGKGLGKDCLGCAAVFKYDLESGRLIKKYFLINQPRVHFLNDLTLNSRGDVFISDTISGDVYLIRRERDELELFSNLGPQSFPNGLALSRNERYLFVAVDKGLRVIDLRNKKDFQLPLPGGVSPGIDGLYFDRQSLIAIQPFEKEKIVRYHLSKTFDAVTEVDVLESDHKLMNQPTTGVVIGRDFYYIANSQLQLLRSIYQADATFDSQRLSEVYVLKTRINSERRTSGASHRRLKQIKSL
ncbi:MAG: hypothetical protein WKF30_15355 [Pyrinomonadaceae bacterium]